MKFSTNKELNVEKFSVKINQMEIMAGIVIKIWLVIKLRFKLKKSEPYSEKPNTRRFSTMKFDFSE